MLKNIVLFIIIIITFSRAFAGELYEVIQAPHRTLRLEAQEIERDQIKSLKFQELLASMFKTMKKNYGVGLAAPQINISKQVFVMGDFLSGVKKRVMINPIIEVYGSDDKRSLEGCLSTKIHGNKVVPRFRELRASYYDQHGEYKQREFKGFVAIVIQHEFDHLQGKLIIDYPQASSNRRRR